MYILSVYKCVPCLTMYIHYLTHIFRDIVLIYQGHALIYLVYIPDFGQINKKFRISTKNITAGLEPMTPCILASCLDHYATSVIDSEQLLQVIFTLLPWHAGWCRTYGSGYSAASLRPPSLWAATLTASSVVLLPSQRHAHEQYNLTRPRAG